MRRSLSLILLFFALASCAPRVPVTSIGMLISKDTVIEVGDYRSIHLVIKPDGATEDVETTSSNPAVAYIERDRIVAVSPGEATITARSTYGGVASSCPIKVIPKRVAIQSASIDKPEITMRMGDSVALNIVVQPQAAIRDELFVEWLAAGDYHYMDRKAGTFFYDKRFATVNGNGYKAFVTGHRFGSTIIEAHIYDPGFDKHYTMECPVNILCKIPDAIDLGLSVLWGSFDLATSDEWDNGIYAPDDVYGTDGFFSWGVLEETDDHWGRMYPYLITTGDGWVTPVTKTFVDIGQCISGTEYDAAHVHLGDKWRIPHMDELQELLDKCTWERVSTTRKVPRSVVDQTINAYKVTGPNGNHIIVHLFSLWSGDLYEQPIEPSYEGDVRGLPFSSAYALWIDNSNNDPEIGVSVRNYAFHIRPVKDK